MFRPPWAFCVLGLYRKTELWDTKFAQEVLKINFEQLKDLYDKAIKDEKIVNSKIAPISCVEKDKLSKEEKEHYEKIGENIIKNRKWYYGN